MTIVARAAASAMALLYVLGLSGMSAPAAAEAAPAATLAAAVSAPIAAAPALLRTETAAARRADAGTPAAAPALATAPKPTAGLEGLVGDKLASATRDDEHECLAASVYFESKGQPVAGQLAVAETILNRVTSGRFPRSACGVVKQRGQFGFVRGGRLPSVPRASQAWKQAVAIAAIAREKLWREVAADALYFNTGRAPSPGLIRVARFGAQIFYR